ncbi:LysM peptidoglycan-binding domain-containing protein [Heliorestis acidaminivorans]|uniref:LysM peptidoglycan-binding domain-containing protein n=1 Tax=Heliorestis acidaminivorans TaxID=553427 RepID=A0A6I0EQ94_9FIRM|nr:LysM peptidoglycan-binding domain-containing protein [Heliorestis acidaminivorans]KAB2952264.1 LysM peptidoglycan-binding domain-containing protein [Heliorestis acidaminivorans]
MRKGSKKFFLGMTLSALLLGMPATTTANSVPATYTVEAGDSLWKISRTFNVTVEEIKRFNNLENDFIYAGQQLKLRNNLTVTHTVQPGETLWILSRQYGVTIDRIKSMNQLKSDEIRPGQVLIVRQDGNGTSSNSSIVNYIVQPNDSLWKISMQFGVSIEALRSHNQLTSDMVWVGQRLLIPQTGASQPVTTPSPTPTPTPTPTPSRGGQSNVTQWPSITYIVLPGDTASSIARRFGVSAQDILRFNYMEPHEWFNAGEKIAINGYAPRLYTVTPGQYQSPAQVGHIVDWFLEGKYLLRRNDVFTVVDVQTNKSFKVKMLGGYNHADVEPLTRQDTAVMREIFNHQWTWTPRAIVVYKDGMNIAASLSGMPHSFNTISDNGVTGHFDIYLLNSTAHGSASDVYIRQHQDMIQKAGGR